MKKEKKTKANNQKQSQTINHFLIDAAPDHQPPKNRNEKRQVETCLFQRNERAKEPENEKILIF
jgi:hypothetical protein